MQEECRRYDRVLQGGVDLLVAGIGVSGHLAFNEAAIDLDPYVTTHVENLSEETRCANARFFGGNIDRVPRRAITQGLGNILAAHRVILLATGPHKAEAVGRAVEQPVSGLCPASFLQQHPDVIFLVNKAAAGKLKRKHGWADCLGSQAATERLTW